MSLLCPPHASQRGGTDEHCCRVQSGIDSELGDESIPAGIDMFECEDKLAKTMTVSKAHHERQRPLDANPLTYLSNSDVS